MKSLLRPLPFLALCLFAALTARTQVTDGIRVTVTYVTSRQIYFDGGSEEGVTVGDTVSFVHAGEPSGKVIITAVASHSAVGRAVYLPAVIKNGDEGSILRKATGDKTERRAPEIILQDSTGTIPLVSAVTEATRPPENSLSGRIAFQYTGEWADDSRLNVAQPAAVASLHLANLLGTGIGLSFYGREYYELSDAYARYGDSVRSRFDLYEFRFEKDDPGDWYGFGAGRMVSRYVSGLGTFDGGQFFLRHGAITSGVLVGKGVEGRALGIGGGEVKTAIFAGFRGGDQPLRSYEASIAYARQTVHGNLDRSFMYLQGSTSLGPDLSMFGNAEVDLQEMSNGQRVSAMRLSSAMVYLNYFPERWLSTSIGYDGTRNVYLFETMKNIPDSLINESIRHGLHARVTYRPISSIALSAMASLGTRIGDPRNTRTLSGGIRLLDLFGSGIHAGARYADITNVSLQGTDITYELERFFVWRINLLLRYDSYSYSVIGNGHAYRTQTISGSASWYFSKSWYSSARGDYVIDDTLNGTRVFVEVGIRF